MKNLCAIFLTFLCCSFMYSQEVLEKQQIEEIEKNILVYRIKNYELGDYRDLLPSNGWSLNLKFGKVRDTFNLKRRDWIFYEVINENYETSNGETSTLKTFTHGRPQFYKLSDKSLIAIDKNKNVIFLGGNFYKTSIADLFLLTEKNIISYSKFLHLKLFHYRIELLNFKKNNKKYLIFEAFSNTISRKIIIKVEKLNPDIISVSN